MLEGIEIDCNYGRKVTVLYKALYLFAYIGSILQYYHYVITNTILYKDCIKYVFKMSADFKTKVN